ncbi:MAG: hypothetical protein CK604_11800 [Curvibacter sp. PD_MW3]|nr:MAG: hypothetical protein CK604_11800 [Curvibacter sp. PD_MW3]
MALPLTAMLPIMAPMQSEHAHRLHQDKTLKELRSVRAIAPLDKVFGESTIHIRVVNDPSQEPLLASIWQPPSQFRQYRLIVFEVDGHQCVKDFLRNVEASEAANFSAEEIVSLSERHALTCLQLEINTFLLLANILRPGSLSAEHGYAFVKNKQAETTPPFFAEHLFYAVEASQRLGWPKFFKPDLLQGWNWLRDSGALADGIGVGHLGRALAAVSHLTASDLKKTSSIELVWILLGLEALYSRSNVGMKEQLLAKTEALLGPRTENKKAFGVVYDFRSRLLHGDVDLPLRFTEFDAVKKFEDFHAELSRNEDLALAVLLATLQWMVVNNTTQLNFTYALS